MLVTSEEAKSLWCPHARLMIPSDTAVAFNRQYTRDDKKVWAGTGTMCMAEKCAAWRWAKPKELRDIDLVTSDIVDNQRLGYCGLSGPPAQGD